MGVFLRLAEAADAPAIAEVYLAARMVSLPWLPLVHSDDDTRRWFANRVLPEQLVCVAEIAGEIVGFAAIHGDWLSNLYVHPAHQGAGIGSALLHWAKEERPEGFRFYVFQRNDRARRFYERHGMVKLSESDGSENEEREPDCVYGF